MNLISHLIQIQIIVILVSVVSLCEHCTASQYCPTIYVGAFEMNRLAVSYAPMFSIHLIEEFELCLIIIIIVIISGSDESTSQT